MFYGKKRDFGQFDLVGTLVGSVLPSIINTTGAVLSASIASSTAKDVARTQAQVAMAGQAVQERIAQLQIVSSLPAGTTQVSTPSGTVTVNKPGSTSLIGGITESNYLPYILLGGGGLLAIMFLRKGRKS